MRLLILLAMVGQSLPAQSIAEVRAGVARALPILQRSAGEFVSKRACVSCHHNILPILMLRLAQSRGVTVDESVLAQVEEKTFRALRGPTALDDAIQAVTLNDPTPNDSLLLMAAHAAGVRAGATAAVYARRLLGWQRDGHWVTSDFRPPQSSSVFTATATAVRAIRLYLPEEWHTARDASLRDARQWLLATQPASTEDAAFRLLGMVWAAAPLVEIDRAEKDLLVRQSRSGGWAELRGYAPDAYSTGEALYALHEAGVPGGAHAWRHGAKFLLSTQAADGTWRVRTRMISPAQVSPEYFSSGFPYRKDEYLSYAGSCWAVMALLTALPEVAAPPAPTEFSEDAARWIRTALFGTPLELSELLDSGLDPNAQTSNGTTLLMMAAPDAEKVKILLSRGANPRSRSGSGCDALTLAAAYRDTAASIKTLLDAGAEAAPPKGVRTRHTALLFASMTGDAANVKLLLAHGADPSAAPSALAAAVTFGYPEIVRALIAAGAPVHGTEASGINLLHWAVIANRPEVIPQLIEAGVSINATDENGYTPLMYAATIDFGDSRSLEALLKAGADRDIRNDQGRTAREQARYYRHRQLEAAFR